MWPVLPSSLTKFTVSETTNRVSETTVSAASWAGAPAIVSTSGTGIISKLRANTVELRFESRLPVDLAYHDSTALTGGMVLQGTSFFDTVTVHSQTSTLLEATYSNASSGDSIRVKFTATSPQEGPDYFDARLVSISISTANRTLGAWDLPHLRLLPPATANQERCLATNMMLRGQATESPFQEYPFGQAAAIYPNDDNATGGTIRRALGSTSENYNPASMQYHHVYDRDSFAGLLMIAADPSAHYKVLFQDADGDQHTCGIRHLPSNGRGRTSLSSSDACGSYGVRLIPFRGELRDSAKEYMRVIEDDITPSWLPATKTLADAREAAIAGWGYNQKRSGMFARSYWFVLTQLANYNIAAGANRGAKAGGGDGMTTTGSGEGLSEAATESRVTTAIGKLITYMGNPDGALVYGACDEAPFENKRNDHWTNFGENVLSYLASRVNYLTIYSLMHQWCADSKWLAQDIAADPAYGWQTALGDPDTYHRLDASGAIVKVTTTDTVVDPYTGGTVSATFSEEQRDVQFGAANARAHIIDLLNRRFITGDIGDGIAPTASLDAIYLDAFTAVSGGEDYRGTLTTDQKGLSSYSSLGMASLSQEMRAARPKNDFGFFSEWPNEPMGTNLDGVSVGTNPINNAVNAQAPLSIGLFNYVWSEYVPRIDFYSGFVTLYSTVPGANNALASSAIQGQYWDLIFQHLVSHGSCFFIQAEFANRVDLVPDDPESPSDPAYTQWNAWASASITFMKSVLDALRTASAAPDIFAGQMLRELEGTAQYNFVQGTLEVTAAGISGAEVHGRAWYASNPKATVYVVLTTAETTSQTFTLKMDRGRYPELPTGTLQVVNMVSSATLASFDNVLSLSVTVPARGALILKIDRA